MTTTPARCPYCNQPQHYVVLTTERRHGTYISASLELHVGHSLTVHPGPGEVNLFCSDCQRVVISAGGNGRWRGEYKMPECRVAGASAPARIRVP